MSVYQSAIHKNYTYVDFDEDLKNVLRRSSKGEKIVYIIDDNDVSESSFLERMNTLLANSEVPGLFEGDELTALMSNCKELSLRDGFILETQEDLNNWFRSQIMKNMHVVFTMNAPLSSNNEISSRAMASPALFNRCVLNWMGDWVNNIS